MFEIFQQFLVMRYRFGSCRNSLRIIRSEFIMRFVVPLSGSGQEYTLVIPAPALMGSHLLELVTRAGISRAQTAPQVASCKSRYHRSLARQDFLYSGSPRGGIRQPQVASVLCAPGFPVLGQPSSLTPTRFSHQHFQILLQP